MASRSSNGTRLSLPAFSSASSLVTSSLDSSCAAVIAGFLAGLDDRVLQLLGQRFQRLHREADRPDRDRVLGQVEVRRDFVELHRLDAGRLVFAGRDHAVLDGVVDFVIGDDGRAHADGRERLRPDRRALHAHLEALEIGQVLERLVGEDVADAAAGIADQHHLGLRRDFVGDRRQDVRLRPPCSCARCP